MDALLLTLLLHTTATVTMCGIVWFVQVVHYPLFARVGRSAFSHYEAAHSRHTALIVVPLMLVELVTAVGLALWLPAQPLVWWGLGLLLAIWASTFLVQVPQHRRLEDGFDVTAHRRLVQTNWLRTIGWSTRGAMSLALLASTV